MSSCLIGVFAAQPQPLLIAAASDLSPLQTQLAAAIHGATGIGVMQAAKDAGMEALALTDHGNLSGAIEFYQEARNHGVKPIIGCEFYVALERTRKKFTKDKVYALTSQQKEPISAPPPETVARRWDSSDDDSFELEDLG
mgnify:CR=1 FL=1